MGASRSIASRIAQLRAPASLEMGKLARDLQARGVDIIDLTTGEPDFPTPAHICEAATAALAQGKTHYTPANGSGELLEAIGRHLVGPGRPEYDPRREIIVTAGSKQGLLITLLALIGEGDEVIVPSPRWISYGDLTALAGGRLVSVAGQAADGFIPTAAALSAAVSSRTKAILLNNPTNPTGAVWKREQLAAVLKVAIMHDLWIISDEVYEAIVFDDQRFVPFAALPAARDRTVTVSGFSKAYAMTGWRVGYIAGPATLMDSISLVHQHTVHCASSVSQAAALAALQGPDSCVRAMVAEYQARRDLLVRGLTEAPRIGTYPIQGTFYALLDVRAIFEDSVEAAAHFLKHAHVATTPGQAYGPGGEGHLRVSFATSRENLGRAIERINKISSLR